MAEKFFELDHVTHVYQGGEGEGHEALRGVTLSIGVGEFVAVLGANGSGKSTLARHLNALLLPSEGQCLVRGMDTRDEARRWDIRQEVSMVFQNPDNQLIAAVVADDVAFGPENLGIPPADIRRRVAEALALVGMERYAQAAPHLLSGGQKQRLALGCAILHRPALLVLDEPTSAVDPTSRRLFWNLLSEMAGGEGTTVFVTTHFMDEAEHCDEIAFLQAGRKIAAGSPAELKDELPARLFVLPYESTGEAEAALRAAHAQYDEVYVFGRQVRALIPRGAEVPSEVQAQPAALSMEDVFIYYDRQQRG